MNDPRLPPLPVAEASLSVVAAYQALIALAALLLWVAVVRRQRASGRPWRDTARSVATKVRRPLHSLLLAVGLVLALDVLLPWERIATQVHHLRPASGGSEVEHVLCCTGGGIAGCEVPGTPALVPGQSIVVQRSRVLGRCSVEPSASPPRRCNCS